MNIFSLSLSKKTIFLSLSFCLWILFYPSLNIGNQFKGNMLYAASLAKKEGSVRFDSTGFISDRKENYMKGVVLFD